VYNSVASDRRQEILVTQAHIEFSHDNSSYSDITVGVEVKVSLLNIPRE